MVEQQPLKRRRRGTGWAFFGILALLAVLLFLLFADEATLDAQPTCACSQENITITALDSTNNNYALVVAVSCLEGTCGAAAEHGGDTSSCQFNVRYEIMRQTDYGGMMAIAENDESLEYQTLFAPDQELEWQGGNTEDWTGSGVDGVANGEQNYWVPCGTTERFEVSVRSSKSVNRHLYRSESDTTAVGELRQLLNLKALVVLQCDACEQ